MRRVPSRSSTSGTRLRRIWVLLSSSTVTPEIRTTQPKVRENRNTGPSTSSSLSLSTRVQVGAANTSSTTIGHEEVTNGCTTESAGTGGGTGSGAASLI